MELLPARLLGPEIRVSLTFGEVVGQHPLSEETEMGEEKHGVELRYFVRNLVLEKEV